MLESSSASQGGKKVSFREIGLGLSEKRTGWCYDTFFDRSKKREQY